MTDAQRGDLDGPPPAAEPLSGDTLARGAEIRERVDAMAPRATPDGLVNTTHVAIEQTLRERNALPSYIAELDGPGKFLPAAEPPQDEQRCTTIGCPNSGIVTAVYEDDEARERVTYCSRCAFLVGGVFTPDRPAVPAAGAVDEAGLAEQIVKTLAHHSWCRGTDAAGDCTCRRNREHDALAVVLGPLAPLLRELAEKDRELADTRAKVLEEAAWTVEQLRPHIPPSTDPDRRTRVIQRSSFNRAASAVRALAPAATHTTSEER